MSIEELAGALRGHLFGSFFLSGGFSWIGFIFGALVQTRTGNPWLGLLATICLGHLAATAAFQSFWWMAHRAFYRTGRTEFLRGIWKMEQDLWPVHSTGFRMSLAFGIITVPLNAGWLLLLFHFAPVAARTLPTGIWVAAIDVMVVHSTFVRIMGDFFESHSHLLALRFKPRLS